jgi:hypothetical protein
MICRLERCPCTHPSHRAGRLQRLALLLAGIVLLVVWNPVESPGPKLCLLRHSVALPCPLCGLTRGLALCLRGHFLQATVLNPLVLLLGLLLPLLAIKWTVEYLDNCVLTVTWGPRTGRVLLVLLNLAVVLGWVYLLVWRREDDFASSWLGRLWSLLFS